MVNSASQNLASVVRDRHISRNELRSRLNDPRLAIVNVMPKETFRDGRIPNSINLPAADINSRAREFLPDLAQEIAVYCAGPT